MTLVHAPFIYLNMDATLVGTLTFSDFKADVYSMSLPGEFKVVYQDSAGTVLEEAPVTGISTYKQREPEILARLQELKEGNPAQSTPDQGDPGEY